jgi:hypothetical protein
MTFKPVKNVGANVSSGMKNEAKVGESWLSVLDTMVMIF